MPRNLFEAIGRTLGNKAGQVKSAYDLMGGTEQDSLRTEIRLGRELSAGLLKQIPPVEENETTRFAAQIMSWLAANVKERKLPFSVRVTAERHAKTVALPGGAIFVSWPLLEMCHGERDQIAFLIGHEMAHIVRRHALDRLVKDSALSLFLRQTSGRHAALAWLGNAGQKLLAGGYSRDDELEADAFAVALVGAAGGDKSAGERFLKEVAQRGSDESIGIAGDYFASHPPLTERIANLRALGRVNPADPSAD